MSAQHTPGPWHWDDYSWLVAKDESSVLEYAGCGSHATDASDADRVLIAAAPDLLAALQGVLRVSDRSTSEYDAVRAAIAKATGRT